MEAGTSRGRLCRLLRRPRWPRFGRRAPGAMANDDDEKSAAPPQMPECECPPGYIIVLRPSTKPARDADGRPPPPRELLARRQFYELPLLNRPRADDATDTPLEAIYRIYEHIVLDQGIEMRNELECFWYHNGTFGRDVWSVCDIPDPRDPDPERYACVSVVPRLLRMAFNDRIGCGILRDAPAISTQADFDEWATRGELAREEDPPWVDNMPPLKETLELLHWDNDKKDFVPLSGFDDEYMCPQFAAKNILSWLPHIYFI